MTTKLTRAEELRNDLENLYFNFGCNCKMLYELDILGQTHTAKYKKAKADVDVLKKNIKRVKAELDAEEEKEFDDYYFSAGMHW